MDLQKSDDAVLATYSEKPTFWINCWIDSTREDNTIPNPCETSECEVEQGGFTTL